MAADLLPPVSRPARPHLLDVPLPLEGEGTGEGAPAAPARVVEYEPALVEEAVLAALRGRREERPFRYERDRIYKIQDPDAREAAFQALDAAWFERLDLGRPVAQALAEQPDVVAGTRACRVMSARSRRDEGAELFVHPGRGGGPEARWIVIRLRPEALRAPQEVLGFLRHELLHIADMLDARFAYEPALPPSPAGPAHDALRRERYRVLWDTCIDGRLARRGAVPPAVRADRLAEFARTFPMLGPATEAAFARFFDGEAPAHPDLVAFATAPDAFGAKGPHLEARIPPRPGGPRPGERCPLCGFPTHAFAPDAAGLPAGVLARIRADFPAWRPDDGLCLQCADLYRSRDTAGSAGAGQ